MMQQLKDDGLQGVSKIAIKVRVGLPEGITAPQQVQVLHMVPLENVQDDGKGRNDEDLETSLG